MRTVVLALFGLVILVPLALAYPWNEEAEVAEGDDDNAIELFNNLQRRGWCARWGDYCVPDAKVKFADCCQGLRCVCGKFWTQAKCQCKRASAFGR